MDAGVIGSIHRPSFRAAGRQRQQPIPDIAHCEQRAAGRIGVACPVERLRILRVAMALERTKLARSQRPRICSVISNPRRAKWLPKLSIKVIP